MADLDTRTPVVVLGGAENSLSVVRSFGRAGIRVSACGDRELVPKSRFIDRYERIPAGVNSIDYFGDMLLGGSREYSGHMLFACGDDAVRFVAENRAELSAEYTLEYHDPAVQLAMLDKRHTLEMASKAGIPTPRFWPVANIDDVVRIRELLGYPAMIKPLDTYYFRRHFGVVSYLRVASAEELTQQAGRLLDIGLEFMVSEVIHGEDDRACSCYTFLDEAGDALFSFTKRVIRRYPRNAGGGTLHMVEYLPEVEALGMQFFRGVGYRGVGNVEFKRDHRDGKLKIIECNARLTAVQEQIVQGGLDMALVSYRYSTGQRIPELGRPRDGVAFWSPRRDWHAFRQVREVTGASYWSWLASLRCKKMVFANFAWDDLGPFLHSVWLGLTRLVSKSRRRVEDFVRQV